MANIKISDLTALTPTSASPIDTGGFFPFVNNGVTTKATFEQVRPSVSVTDFGATGDGVTNDTAAFQAAYNAVKANGGTVIIPPPSAYYLLESPLNFTRGATDGQRGIIFRCEGGQDTGGADDPQIIGKHTGHMFDCSGNPSLTFENFCIGTDSTTIPSTGWFFARDASAGTAGKHRFLNCRATGKFTTAVLYNYGAEEIDYVGCLFTNSYTAGASAVVCITGYNIKSLSSSFITIATGAQSTLINNFYGGSFYNNSSHAQADAFYIEAASAVRWFGGWMMASTGAAAGRALVYVDTTNAASDNCSLDGVTGENAADDQNYGVYFGDTVRTCTGWSIKNFRIPNKTRAIFAHANVTLDSLHVDQISEVVAHGLQAAGTIQNSYIHGKNLIAIIGTSTSNTIIGNQANWTITTSTNANYHNTGDFQSFTIDTSGLTLGGVLTKVSKFEWHGRRINLYIRLSDTVSINCAAGTALLDLPVSAALNSADVQVANMSTAVAIGAGCIAGTTLYLPAIAVGADPIVITASYDGAA